MEIRGTTKLLGVFGDPIAHTLSPLIHRILIQERGDDLCYVPLRVRPEDLSTALKGVYAMDFQGINLTIPHKQAVIPYCRRLDESALYAGAVNTLKRTDEGFIGYNTDIYGFETLVGLVGVPAKGAKVLILGAGGAAHSAICASRNLGAAEIVIANRTYERGLKLVQEFQAAWEGDGPDLRTVSMDSLSREAFPIVFQTTSAGMKPHTETLPVPRDQADFYRRIEYAVDMVFNPGETAFLKEAASYGAKVRGGLSMLFFQGVKAYEIWTDKAFSEDEKQRMHEVFLDLAGKELYDR